MSQPFKHRPNHIPFRRPALVGKYILSELESRGQKVSDLDTIPMRKGDADVLKGILSLNPHSAMTPSLAVALEGFFGINCMFWIACGAGWATWYWQVRFCSSCRANLSFYTATCKLCVLCQEPEVEPEIVNQVYVFYTDSKGIDHMVAAQDKDSINKVGILRMSTHMPDYTTAEMAIAHGKSLLRLEPKNGSIN